MKSLTKSLLTCLALSAIGLSTLAQAKPEQGQRGTPPPEAYTACEGKSEGDSAQFEHERRGTVEGTCVERDGKLILKPNRK